MDRLTEGKNRRPNSRLYNRRGQQMSHYALLMGTVAVVAITMQNVVRRQLIQGLQGMSDRTLTGALFRAEPETVSGLPGDDTVTLVFRIPGANFCEASGSSQWSGFVGTSNADASVTGEVSGITVTEPTTFTISCDVIGTADPGDRQVYAVHVGIATTNITSSQNIDEIGAAGFRRGTVVSERITGQATGRDIQVDIVLPPDTGH